VSDNPLSELFAMVAEEQKKQEKEDEKLAQLSNFVENLAIVQQEEIPEEVEVMDTKEVSDHMEQMVEEVKARALTELKEEGVDLFGTSPSVKTADPLTPFDQKYATKEEMQKHYTNFLTRIQQQLSTIGGGGEVKFLRLDDVIRQSATDNWVLEYDAATGKVQFTDVIGPISVVKFDVNHDASTFDHQPGDLSWNGVDETLNIFHPGGVVQQVGQELYAYVRNNTGSAIQNGVAVRFDGAEQNGTARLEIAPMVANKSVPSLYGLGIATTSILDGEDGKVTVWGKVRSIDTSAFEIGDILYISPDVAGELTNVKPTAPNNVIPIAAVLRKDATDGQIFVRPTIEIDQLYGRFARTTDQTAASINTANAVEFDDTESSNGIEIGTPATRLVVEDSGFYQFDVSLQITTSNNKGVVIVWFRKNGVDVPYSSRRTTVTNGDTFTLSASIQISLAANDYVEIMWAISATGIFLDANPDPIVGPPVASVLVSAGQLQL